MVNSDDWNEYKHLIMSRLDDISELEKEVVDIKIKLAVLTSKVVLITTGVAIIISGLFTGIVNHFLTKGSA